MSHALFPLWFAGTASPPFLREEALYDAALFNQSLVAETRREKAS